MCMHFDFARGTAPWSTCLRKTRQNVASPTQGATPKRGSLYPQLKGPHRSVGVHIPNSRGHAKAWESVSPTQGATPKRGSPYPQLKGARQSVGACIPNSRGHAKAWESVSGHTEAWESVSPTQGATPKHWKERKKDERNKAVPALAPQRIFQCTWAGLLLRMQDLHFATNDICTAPHLAEFVLKSASQQTTFV